MTEQLLETSIIPIINNHSSIEKVEQPSQEAIEKQKDDVNNIDCMLDF
jgi:hypothetical protein